MEATPPLPRARRAAAPRPRQAADRTPRLPVWLDLMEERLPAVRRWRRPRAFWVPSLGTPCGIAEYTGHLAAHLPATRLLAGAPPLDEPRLMHVQHEHSLFDDAQLARHLEELRRAGGRVVITEHSVPDAARGWEYQADALIGLTRSGVETLRRRHPRMRVEMLPIGCATWFPPRRQRRGRVIGGFGFLEPYKGFWRLLDVLRALSGAELVLYSYAKRPELAADWEWHAAGLPVRRHSEYLPEQTIAERLAAEADVLVYWYDEIPHASASAAVRIGLASGVPVLASPTSWFADLTEVTYQPDDLLAGVERLLADDALRDRLARAARGYCLAHSWDRIAARHAALWRTVEADT